MEDKVFYIQIDITTNIHQELSYGIDSINTYIILN